MITLILSVDFLLGAELFASRAYCALHSSAAAPVAHLPTPLYYINDRLNGAPDDSLAVVLRREEDAELLRPPDEVLDVEAFFAEDPARELDELAFRFAS